MTPVALSWMNGVGTANLTLVVAVAVLVGSGVYLLLERTLTRVVLGTLLIGNGVNLLILIGGGVAGGAPILGRTPIGSMSDPLPEAMILTAIVITLGVSAFLLAVAYRSWQLTGDDEVQNDYEDYRVIERSEHGDDAEADADADTDEDPEEPGDQPEADR